MIRCKQKQSLKIETIFHVHSYNMCMFLKESRLGRCNGIFQLAALPQKIHPEVLTFRYAHKRGLYLVNPAPGRSQHLQNSPSNKNPSFKQHQKKIGEENKNKKTQLFVASNLSRFKDDMFLNLVSCHQNQELFVEILTLNR